jgi:hypothetical protein
MNQKISYDERFSKHSQLELTCQSYVTFQKKMEKNFDCIGTIATDSVRVPFQSKILDDKHNESRSGSSSTKLDSLLLRNSHEQFQCEHLVPSDIEIGIEKSFNAQGSEKQT